MYSSAINNTTSSTSAMTVWEQCLNIIKSTISEDKYQQWFKPLEPVAFDPNEHKLVIKVPSYFFYEYIESNFLPVLSKALKKVIGPDVKLQYLVPNPAGSKAKQKRNTKSSTIPLPGTTTPIPEMELDASTQQNVSPYYAPGIQKPKIKPNFNEEYTLENFIVGECNRAAYNAGLTVAKKPGFKYFNPLLIYGPVGTGKTHLVQGIGREIYKLHNDKKIQYFRADEFENFYSNYIKDNRRTEFLAFFKQIDVLIIDDIQELVSKEGTLKVFLSIINDLHQSQKQLIFTSDRPPTELEKIFDKRIYSRITWGSQFELKQPDYKTRIEILKRKAYEAGMKINDRVIQYIAEHITSNVRELVGALNSIIAHAVAYGQRNITLELTKKVLKNTISSSQPQVTINDIKKIVADYYKIEVKALEGSSRSREIAQARHIAMYLAKQYLNMSLKQIGAEFGNRDHSTVLHGIKSIKNLRQVDPTVRQDLEYIERMLKY